MKKFVAISVIIITALIYISFTSDDKNPVPIPASVQRSGDAATGYQYLITGDYLKSGLPYQIFKIGMGKNNKNYLLRDGDNKDIPHDFNAIKAPNGELVVVPNCLQCHSQVFEDKLVIGLGNSLADFTDKKATAKTAAAVYNVLSIGNGKRFEASKSFLTAVKTIGPDLYAEVKGVNLADRLAALLVAHRNPETFVWNKNASLKIPDQVIPSDVPAWWLLKKKNAMFYNGLGRGDFAKFLMASNLLTVTDTAEAREVESHFSNVLAYIKSIKPPKYPKDINVQLAASGQKLFDENCAKCHGTYGNEETYPNLLIPASVIGTDSALYTSNYSNSQFVDWFNASWFTKGDHPAQLVPFKGYIAPPLDGVWITAPYFHNGSVPTIEAVLNSDLRPTYWQRNFDKPEYDYENLGWKYTTQGKKTETYNTTLFGYGNYGHYFGDKLNDAERKAVIEYLKTL